VASVESRTRISIDELVNGTVTGGRVTNGRLVLTTRGGAGLDAGPIYASTGTRWWASGAYTLGQIVGYAGVLWECMAPNTNKPPALNYSSWRPLSGADPDVWAGADWNFDAEQLEAWWGSFWHTGTSTPSLTTTSGEFETGRQALKLTMAASSSQQLYQWDENVVRGGEQMTLQVRAKVLSGTAVVDTFIIQSDAGIPEPYGAGTVTTGAAETAQYLTTSWATYSFTMTALNAKPRAKIPLRVTTLSGSPAVVVIDWVRIKRVNASPLGAYPVGSYFYTDSTKNPAELLGGGIWARAAQGRVLVGLDEGQTEFDTAGETGGEKTHVLTTNEMPSHSHGGATGNDSPDHSHSLAATINVTKSNAESTATGTTDNGGHSVNAGHTTARFVSPLDVTGGTGGASTRHSHSISAEGGGAAHNNLPPYLVTYIWKRTA
jgi:microcystin-dependent protein